MSTAYVVKETTTGKYISKKDWYRPTLGKVPVLYTDESAAQEAAGTLVRLADTNAMFEDKWLNNLKAKTSTYRKEVQVAREALEIAETTGVPSLIAAAKDELATAEGAFTSHINEITTQQAQTTKAAVFNQSVFVVLPIELP